MATSDLLNLSNLVLGFKSKVRQTDNDPVVMSCEAIGEWDEETIAEISGEANNKIHNFVINHRWILNKETDPKQPLIICRSSDVPMPQRFCATFSESYVKQYKMDQPDGQCKVLEDLFREIDELAAESWGPLKEELEVQLRAATSKNPPNFIMAHKLQDGIRKVEELASVDSPPGDLLSEMSDKLLARNRHRLYLDQVMKGLHKIKKAQMDHQMGLKNARVALAQMVEFSVTPAPPLKLTDAAKESGTQLRLDRVAQRFVSLKINRRANLTNCTFAPTATFELKQLQKDGVVIDVAPSLGGEVAQKTMSITFTFNMDAGVDLEVGMVKKKTVYTLRQLKISSEQLQEFKRAQEGEQINLPHGSDKSTAVMVVEAAKLSKLLTGVQTGQ